MVETNIDLLLDRSHSQLNVTKGCRQSLVTMPKPSDSDSLKWSEWSESNRRPLLPESSALPSCATSRRWRKWLEVYVVKL
jgi:hypothetical protein